MLPGSVQIGGCRFSLPSTLLTGEPPSKYQQIKPLKYSMCADLIINGPQAGNCAFSILLWDKLLKPYQKASSFFAEFVLLSANSLQPSRQVEATGSLDIEQVLSYSLFSNCFTRSKTLSAVMVLN